MELSRLSSSSHVLPPSIDRKKPIPRLVRLAGRSGSPVACASPVPARIIDWFGSLLRATTVIAPMCSPWVGASGVKASQVGPVGSLVRKFVVFQMPPAGVAIYAVLPDG